jgi:hypothetical protein
MPQDPAHYINPVESPADFTYTITVKEIKIQDTGKGTKLVADDLEAVLRKIEGWHQGSIGGFLISYRDTDGVLHQISWPAIGGSSVGGSSAAGWPFPALDARPGRLRREGSGGKFLVV